MRDVLQAMLLLLLAGALAAPARGDGWGGAPAPAEVILEREAAPEGAGLALGDIARVRGGSAELRRALVELPIVDGAWDGRPRTVTREEVEDLLVRRGLVGDGLAVLGAPLARVLPSRWRDVDPAELLGALAGGLRESGALPPDVDLEWASVPATLRTAPGRTGRRVEVLDLEDARRLALRPGARTRVVARIVVDETPLEALELFVRALRVREVVVAKEPLEAGAVLTGARIEVRRVPTDGCPSDALRDVPSARGRRLTRDLDAGAPVASRDAPLVPLVRRGETVTLRVRRGPLVITATGIARHDGTYGRTISAANVDSGELVHGVVAGPGLLDVRTGSRQGGAGEEVDE